MVRSRVKHMLAGAMVLPILMTLLAAWSPVAQAADLYVGCLAVVGNTGGIGLKVHSAPGLSSPTIALYYDGMVVTIVGGPQWCDGFRWWQHKSGGIVGWSAANWLYPLANPTLPGQPTGLTATRKDSGSTPGVFLSWTGGAGATGYYFYRDGSGRSLGAQTSYWDYGLTAGQTYRYYVVAVNSAGTSSPSATVSYTVPASTPALPGQPTGLTAIRKDNGSTPGVFLSWTGSNRATSYEVYRGHRRVAGVNAPLTSYSDSSGLTVGSTYTYYVVAVNSAGRSSPSNTVSYTVPASTPALPGQPTGLTATRKDNGSTPSVFLSWTGSNRATSYEVYRGQRRVAGVNAPLTSYSDSSGLTVGSTYTYYVVAVNSAGRSSPSNTVSYTVPASTLPSLIVFQDGADHYWVDDNRFQAADIMEAFSKRDRSLDVGYVPLKDLATALGGKPTPGTAGGWRLDAGGKTFAWVSSQVRLGEKGTPCVSIVPAAAALGYKLYYTDTEGATKYGAVRVQQIILTRLDQIGNAEVAIWWAQNQANSRGWYGYCMRFVSDAFKFVGVSVHMDVLTEADPTARALAEYYYTHQDTTKVVFHHASEGVAPPLGAIVFYGPLYLTGPVPAGHIGISLGNGRVVHAYGPVQETALYFDGVKKFDRNYDYVGLTRKLPSADWVTCSGAKSVYLGWVDPIGGK